MRNRYTSRPSNKEKAGRSRTAIFIAAQVLCNSRQCEPSALVKSFWGISDMGVAQPVEILGAVAGFCTTFAFVPQIVKIYRQGGRDLSYGMLVFYLLGVLLWLAYGMLLHAPSVI